MTPAERDAYETMLQTLCGVRMLASLEAKAGQSRWIEALPLIDDAVEQGMATLNAQ